MLTTLKPQGQYIYTQEHGHTVVYEVKTINNWYCAWCHDGPMSCEINLHCASCGRCRDQYSTYESRQERRRVRTQR